MTREQGARTLTAGAFETTYGTAPSSGYFQLPFASNTVSKMQGLLASELLGFGRDPLEPDLDTETTDGDIVVPIGPEDFGFWLKATLGAPTTTGTDPYTHVFNSGGWALPSLSLERAFPSVPYFAMATGARVNSMTFGMQRSGQLQATLGIVAQSQAKATTTQSGSKTSFAQKRFVQRHGAITRGGSAIANIVSAELTYSNNLDRIETIRADGKIDGLDPTMATLSGRLVARFADETLLNQALAGDPAAFAFSFTRPDASLTFAVPRVFLPTPKVNIEGPAGIQVEFEWQAAQNTSSGPMLTATLINEVESY
jgi:hypothetical protein